MGSVEVASGVSIGGSSPLALIAGPCLIESEDSLLRIADSLREISERRGVSLVFKSSFDKANRSSITSPRGPGSADGLAALGRVKREIGVPVTTDIHEVWQAGVAAEVVDILQIPALLCRQTDLLVAAARTGRVVNVKKGQFLAPPEMANVVEKLHSSGTSHILVTERGSSFGYNNLIVDFRSLPQLRALGYPVVFDATHSVQLPGARGHASGGQREFVGHLARAAAAVGIDGLFIETHPDPDAAPSDGPNMLTPAALADLLDEVLAIRSALSAIPSPAESSRSLG
jgi:2-dehydro-3-deoxyphosphooctonate aldolase (KDO 8-P synthase)